MVCQSAAADGWRPLKIGGGGFLTGMDFSPDGTTRCVRTDTYGAYCYDAASGRWVQVVTSSSMPSSDVIPGVGEGVYELRVAPSAPLRLYMALAGYVFSSTDRGTHWARTSFSRVPMDPNDSYRTSGEKMAVDPINPDVVYLGTQSNGLWVTTTGGQSWVQGGRRSSHRTDHGNLVRPFRWQHGWAHESHLRRDCRGGRLSHPRRRCDLDLDSRRAIRRCDARNRQGRRLLRGVYGGQALEVRERRMDRLHAKGWAIPSFHSIAFDPSTPGRLVAASDSGAIHVSPRQRSHVAIRLVLPDERHLPGRPVALLRISGRWSREQQPDVRPRGSRETLDDCRHDPLVCTAAGRSARDFVDEPGRGHRAARREHGDRAAGRKTRGRVLGLSALHDHRPRRLPLELFADSTDVRGRLARRLGEQRPALSGGVLVLGWALAIQYLERWWHDVDAVPVGSGRKRL